MVVPENVSPLWVQPLLIQERDVPEIGHYEIIQRVVSESPKSSENKAEIETSLEVYFGPNKTPLWKRVVVRSGPSIPTPVVHASFQLPSVDGEVDDFAPSNALCWTAFPEQPHHKLLCVLASPNILCIWDVYPKKDEPSPVGEGHYVTLPFEASSIHPIEGGQSGLLLQRQENVEDHMEVHQQQQPWPATTGATSVDDEDDSFLLKPPPQPVRTSIDTIMSTTTTSASSAVPSLFSLSHPLDDVLPLSNMPTSLLSLSAGGGVIADVFEKILHVGELTRTNAATADYLDRRQFSHSICVTYHTQRKRHAIWEIREAPPPPAPAPLWQVSSQWRGEDRWSSHLGVFQQDLEDMELLGGMADSSSPGVSSPHYDTASRKDALADALGIRKTPRKVVDDVGKRPRNATKGSRSVTRGPRKSVGTSAVPAANANMSLLSPLSRPGVNESAHGMMDVDVSLASATVGGASIKPPLLTVGPFASLSPKLSLTCIYEERIPSPQALDVFLASKMDGSGRQMVCLVTPEPEGVAGASANQLRSFTLDTKTDHMDLSESDLEHQSLAAAGLVMSPQKPIPCISAVPLVSSKIPSCFQPHPRFQRPGYMQCVTDILMLTPKGEMCIYRGNTKLATCELDYTDERDSSVAICGVENSVRNRFDVLYENEKKVLVVLRAVLPVSMFSEATSERIIDAVESSIFSLETLTDVDRAELASKFRMDCLRLEQALLKESVEDSGIEAIGGVLSALVENEFLERGLNDSAPKEQPSRPSTSAWESLLQTNYHSDFELACPDGLTFGTPTPPVSFEPFGRGRDLLGSTFSYSVDFLQRKKQPVCVALVQGLHTLYEDFKLFNASSVVGLKTLSRILTFLCSIVRVGGEPFLEYYQQDLGETWCRKYELRRDRAQSKGANPPFGKPFSILSWIDEIMSSKSNDSATLDPNMVNAACQRTVAVVRAYKQLYSRNQSSVDSSTARDLEVVRILVDEGFRSLEYLRDSLPAGVGLPLLEVLHRCKAGVDLPNLELQDSKMWSMIGREDLCRNVDSTHGTIENPPRITKDDDNNIDETLMEDKDLDGLSPLEYTSSMLYPEDNRMREVGRLLRSSHAIYLNVPRAIEVSDHDYERLKQEKLLLLSRRILALPLGRGMVTTGNLKPVPAEPLPFPDLRMVGRVPPTNAMLALDTSECPADMRVWPDFHNGVAAGLRLPKQKDAGELVSKITRTWIVYNRPEEENSENQNTPNQQTNENKNMGHTHGGLLMALGLKGHLTTLEMTDIFDYLTQGSVTTTVGVLLGMAANMRGTCDISVSKMLCLHIPSLIPQHFSAIDVVSSVQAAAVSGTGLLYQGSSHRMMTEFLLNEIGKRPSSDNNVIDREAYTLSCGIALGMVNLGKGYGVGIHNENAGLADLKIEERLYRYIVGGLDDAELRLKRDEGDRLSLPSTSVSTGNEKCSCIFEGSSINTDVTSPGATLALGLIYIMSGNETIASAISLPDTHFNLEYVRPDFLMLRVISRSLILWDDVKPSRDWILAQLPTSIKDSFEEMTEYAKHLAGQSSSVTRLSQDFDRQAVRLCYAYVIAGACFSLGLRFAGTGNRDAAEAIFERVMELKDFRDGVDAVSNALRPPGPVLEMCLCNAAVSLAMVMAGTGDIDTLKVLKMLRWRCEDDINYGSHMAFGSAIGLLFLGGGTCTLGREPEDIAALVTAFYPRYPSTTSDNQYHLQALRNLYVLAVKRRDIRAVDVDTGETVFVPIKVHFDDKNATPMDLTSPCLLVNTKSRPSRIHVDSERYYPVVVNLDGIIGGKIIYVKRRSAYLSYKQDPDSKRSLLVQTGSLGGGVTMNLISSFTNNPSLLAFAKHFCGLMGEPSKTSHTEPFSLQGFCRTILYECLVLDSQEAIPLYLSLRTDATCCHQSPVARTAAAWTFRLIQSYYMWRSRVVGDDVPCLLNSELLMYLTNMLEQGVQGKPAAVQNSGGGVDTGFDGAASLLYRGQVSTNESMDLS